MEEQQHLTLARFAPSHRHTVTSITGIGLARYRPHSALTANRLRTRSSFGDRRPPLDQAGADGKCGWFGESGKYCVSKQ